MERFATKIFSATKRCNNVVTIQNNVATMLREEEEKQPLAFGLLASGVAGLVSRQPTLSSDVRSYCDINANVWGMSPLGTGIHRFE